MARTGENGIKICRGDMYLEQLEERIVLDGAAEPSEATADLVGITPGEGIFDGQVHEIEGDEFLFYNNRGWWWDPDAWRWGYCFEYANGNWWEQTDAGWHLMTGAPWDYASFAQKGDLIFDGEFHYVNQRWMQYYPTLQETWWGWDGEWRYRFDYEGGPDGRGQWYFMDYEMANPQWQLFEEVVPLGYMVHDPDGSGGYKQVKLVSGVMMFENRWYLLPAGHDSDWYFYLPGGGTGGAGKAWFFCEGNLDYVYDFGKNEEEAWSGYRGLAHEGLGGYIGESKFLFHEPGGSHEVVEIIDAGDGDDLKFAFEYVHYDPSTFGQTFKVAAVGAGVGQEEWLETNTIKLSDYGSSTSMQELTDRLHDLWLAHGHYYFDTVMIDGDAVADSNLKIGSTTITEANVATYADLFRQWGGYLATMGHRSPYVEFLAPELASGEDGMAILTAIETYINQNVPWNAAQVWANSDAPPADLSDEQAWDLDWSTAGGDPLAKEHLLYFVFEHPATGEFLYSDVWDDGALYAYNAWDHDGVQYVYHGWRYGWFDMDEDHGVNNNKTDYLQYHSDGVKWWWDKYDDNRWEPFETWFNWDDGAGDTYYWAKNHLDHTWLDFEDSEPGEQNSYVQRWHSDLSTLWYSDPVHGQLEVYGVWFNENNTLDSGDSFTRALHLFEAGEWRTYYNNGGTTKDHWRENEHGDSTNNYYFRDISGYIEWWDSFGPVKGWERWQDDTWSHTESSVPGSTETFKVYNTWYYSKYDRNPGDSLDELRQYHSSESWRIYDGAGNWKNYNVWENNRKYLLDFCYIDEDGGDDDLKLRQWYSDQSKEYYDPYFSAGWVDYEKWFTDPTPGSGDRVWVEWNYTYHDKDGGDDNKWLRRTQEASPTWTFDDQRVSGENWEPWDSWHDAGNAPVAGDTYSREMHTYANIDGDWTWITWYDDSDQPNNLYRDNEHGDSSHHYYFKDFTGTWKWYDWLDDHDWETWEIWDDDGTYWTKNTWDYSYHDTDGSHGRYDFYQDHGDGKWWWDDSVNSPLTVHWEPYQRWFNDGGGVRTYNDDGFSWEDPDGGYHQWLKQDHATGDRTVLDRDQGGWHDYLVWQYDATGFWDGTDADVYYDFTTAYYDTDAGGGDFNDWKRDLDTGVWYEWSDVISDWENRGTNPS